MSAFFFWFLLKLLPLSISFQLSMTYLSKVKLRLSPMVKLLGQFEFEFELLHTHE
jgi:hypothetical protein